MSVSPSQPRGGAAPRRAWLAGCLLLPFLAAGCGNADDLQAWVDQQRATVRARVKPIKPPEVFNAEPYAGMREPDPFDPQKLLQALRRDTVESPTQALITAQLQRRREPLEAYPLDTMAMVGVLSQGARTVALVRMDNRLFQVAVGNHIGQNYGRVTRITATAIELLEVVQDASGEWIERPVTLPVQEGSGK